MSILSQHRCSESILVPNLRGIDEISFQTKCYNCKYGTAFVSARGRQIRKLRNKQSLGWIIDKIKFSMMCHLVVSNLNYVNVSERGKGITFDSWEYDRKVPPLEQKSTFLHVFYKILVFKRFGMFGFWCITLYI